ncbi:AI-2E family transporter [Fusobacterium sp. PH5-44]|uniref:AI-2E family transporter n=1 Tax=unclassified Fusobacterium TaxID=2648384 RepID=UPI003D2182B2
MENEKKISYTKLILIGILLIIIQSFLQQYEMFSEIYKKYIGYLTPILYAFFTAIFLDPIVKKMERKYRMVRWKAVGITVAIVSIFFIVFFGIVVPQIVGSFKELYGKFPQIQEKATDLVKMALTFLRDKELLIIDDAQIENSVLDFIRKNMGKIQRFSFSAMINVATGVIALSKFFIGVFLGILILLDKKYFLGIFSRSLMIIFGKERSIHIRVFVNKSRHMLLTYLWGRLIVSIIVAGIVLVISVLTSVPYALLSSVMMLIGNMIPYVGPTVAGTVSVFLLLVSPEPRKVIPFLIAVGIAQFCDSFVVGPRIVSDAVGMRAFWVIISIMIGGSLFGPLGMFFGVPALCVVRQLYYHYLDKKQISRD